MFLYADRVSAPFTGDMPGELRSTEASEEFKLNLFYLFLTMRIAEDSLLRSWCLALCSGFLGTLYFLLYLVSFLNEILLKACCLNGGLTLTL